MKNAMEEIGSTIIGLAVGAFWIWIFLSFVTAGNEYRQCRIKCCEKTTASKQ